MIIYKSNKKYEKITPCGIEDANSVKLFKLHPVKLKRIEIYFIYPYKAGIQ